MIYRRSTVRHLTHIQFGMFAIAVLVLSMGVAGTAFAETITILNHSFEDDGASASPPTNWEKIGPAGAYKYGSRIAGQDGLYIGYLNPDNPPTPAGLLWQDTGETFVAGTEYTLKALVATPSHMVLGQYANWEMALYDAATDTPISGASDSGAILVDNTTSYVMVEKSFTYTAVAADAGKEIQVRLIDNGDNSGPTNPDAQVCFDNILLTSLVPEPGSLALLLGVVAAMWIIRVKR